jgi:hypothetical protein
MMQGLLLRQKRQKTTLSLTGGEKLQGWDFVDAPLGPYRRTNRSSLLSKS